MKRIMAVAIALVTLLAFSTFGMTACNGSSYGDDTFEGAISKASFTTEEDAVKGFLSTEISGEAVDATLVDYEAKKDLSETEIADLALGEIKTNEVISAKEVEIKYVRDSIYDYSADSDEEEDYFVFTVYVIEYSRAGAEVHEFKYYVPKAKNGDVLTRSYYEDLLSSEKYLNCTQEYVSTIKSSTMGITMNAEQTFTIKVAGDKASLTMKVINPTSAVTGNITYNYIDGYFEYDKETDKFTTYLSVNNGEYTLDTSNIFLQYGIYDMNSFAAMNIPKIDYSYYEKTDFGFKIQEAFLNKYMGDALGSVVPGANLECYLNVYVSGGKIGKMESYAHAEMSISGISTESTNSETLIFKDFGTTTVETPDIAK